jgi:pimeloyl-ACP methyl ester carboxylesterase
LIGYSGGGAIAVLVAARRSDVVALRTIAGNLDHVAFTRYHKVTPMSASLNAADVIDQVRRIPQVHYAGAEDTVVPPSLIENFVARVGESARVVVVRNATHAKGWKEFWGTEIAK